MPPPQVWWLNQPYLSSVTITLGKSLLNRWHPSQIDTWDFDGYFQGEIREVRIRIGQDMPYPKLRAQNRDIRPLQIRKHCYETDLPQ